MYEGLKDLEVPRSPKHPRARRVARYTMVGVLSFAVFAAAMGGYTYFKVKGNLGEGVDTQLKNLAEQLPGEPLNILVLGSDSRRGITRADKRKGLGGPGGKRADVIMVLHIGEDGKNASLVSIPRDLRVEIPGRGLDKINAAFAYGGANLMIRTVKKLTGLKINHFIEVNFFGFRGIVNAVGGVPITTDRAISDDKAKLEIPGPGCWILDGDDALAWVRARNFDPTADIGRISRQQNFLRALAKQIRRAPVLLNPTALIRISDEIGQYFRYDEHLVGGTTLNRARSIAARLATFDDRKLDFRIVPNDSAFINGISYLIMRESEAEALFAALRNDTKLPDVGKTGASVPKRKDVRVTVLNATKKAGLATTHTNRLRKKGFQMYTPGNTTPRARTVIQYEVDDKLKADLLKKLYPGAKLVLKTRDLPGDLILKIGKDQLKKNDGATGDETPAEPAPAETPKATCKRL